MFNVSHKIAITLIYLSLLNLIVGLIITMVSPHRLPMSGADIAVISSSLLALSVPFGFVSLVSSYRNGVITLGNMAMSFIASLFFFVFGYIAVMFMLGASIKEHKHAAA